MRTNSIKKVATKQTVHFTENYLLNPTNPVKVNLIGCGGTGSQVLTALARIHISLLALGHAGLQVMVYDDDIITEANLGRQLFTAAELGMLKSVALVNRLNRFFGTNWKSIPEKFTKQTARSATIILSCVDTVTARRTLSDYLQEQANTEVADLHRPLYWMDWGNHQITGQVLLSTINEIEQPSSRKFITRGILPLITEEYKQLLEDADDDDTPSCSLAEALNKQDLFINASLAQMGCSLLWRLFRSGMITERGFFLNLGKLKAQPIPIV